MIYESPDQGKTIYVRKEGETDRVLYMKDRDDYIKSWLSNLKDEALWKDILVEANNNPALQAMLDEVKLYYYLSKQNHD